MDDGQKLHNGCRLLCDPDHFLGISTAWSLGLRSVLRKYRVSASRTTSRSARDKVGRVTHHREQGRDKHNERAFALLRQYWVYNRLCVGNKVLVPSRIRFLSRGARSITSSCIQRSADSDNSLTHYLRAAFSIMAESEGFITAHKGLFYLLFTETILRNIPNCTPGQGSSTSG